MHYPDVKLIQSRAIKNSLWIAATLLLPLYPATASAHSHPHVVNVLDYIDSADDQENDIAGILAARNDAQTTGKPLYFPAGTYIVTDHFSISDNMTVFGDGTSSKIVATAGVRNAYPIQADAKKNISITNLSIENGGIQLKAVDDFTLAKLKISGTAGNGVLARGCTNGAIRDNSISDTGTGGSSRHAISLASREESQTAVNSRRISVSGNRIMNPSNSGINVSASSEVTVVGNTIVHDGVNGLHDSGYGGIRVSNNSAFNTVSGNTIRGVSRGVFVAGTAARGNIIMGNTIINSGQEGILVQSSGTNVTNNKIRNVGLGVANNWGIKINDAAANCRISGNHIVDSSSQCTRMAFGIFFAQNNSGAKTVVSENYIEGYGTAAIGNDGNASPSLLVINNQY